MSRNSVTFYDVICIDDVPLPKFQEILGPDFSEDESKKVRKFIEKELEHCWECIEEGDYPDIIVYDGSFMTSFESGTIGLGYGYSDLQDNYFDFICEMKNIDVDDFKNEWSNILDEFFHE